LKHLLQLAVDDAAAATGSSSPLNNAAAHPMQQQQKEQQQPSSNPWHLSRLRNSAAQQQQWGTAASRAVQIFSLQDLQGASSSSSGGLDPNAWQQALLLQPQLLDQVLEAAAAAVLQPLVPAGQLAGNRLDGLQPQQQQQIGCTVDSAVREQTAGASSSSSIVALLTSSKLPWQQLPAILAANPILMFKVRIV
jgi:hypothetical protein